MTEPLGAGNSREYDILGIKMFDSAELKVHMTGKAILRTGAKSQGQGHETTWAQIVAHELGIPAEDMVVEEGDTDTAPFGMGTYASRSTPVAGAAVAMVSRKIRAKARKLAAHLLEVSEEDVEWELGRFYVRSAPDRGVTIQECAMAAYSNMPDGMEPGLENTAYYDPPNLTWPFAVYIVTVEVDPETGVWDVLNMVAVDDCGVRINPMIVEGQIMGGLTEAYAMANMQFITFDAEGNCVGASPERAVHERRTPGTHHRPPDRPADLRWGQAPEVGPFDGSGLKGVQEGHRGGRQPTRSRGRRPSPLRAGSPPRQAGNRAPRRVVLEMADGIPTWEEVARDHGQFLYNVAYRLAGNSDDAQDLVQEALIRVRRGLERYEPGSLEGWLARIVTNVFLDEVRRRRRRPTDSLPDDPDRVVPPSPAADAAEVASGLSDEIQAALAALPEEFRVPVVLCDVADQSYEQIAAALGVPIGTVRSRLHRGRKLLRGMLTEGAA